MDFGLRFIRTIEDVIISKVHFDKDVNYSWGQAQFERNISHG